MRPMHQASSMQHDSDFSVWLSYSMATCGNLEANPGEVPFIDFLGGYPKTVSPKSGLENYCALYENVGE